MKKIEKKPFSGFTLIETMVVVAIVSIAFIGMLSFRYHCVTQAKRADVQINAARLGEMLLETWKGMGGFSSYDPSAEFPLSTFGSQFAITTSSTGPAAQTGFTPLASMYKVLDKANNVYYYATLSYKPKVSPEPLALNATIVWRQGYTEGSITADCQTLRMTTYVN